MRNEGIFPCLFCPINFNTPFYTTKIILSGLLTQILLSPKHLNSFPKTTKLKSSISIRLDQYPCRNIQILMQLTDHLQRQFSFFIQNLAGTAFQPHYFC